jgi:DNA-nicking Smr family endonuclease
VAKRPFNNPFSKLRRSLVPKPAPAPTPEPQPQPAALSDEEIWAQATSGVRPIDLGAGHVLPRAPSASPQRFYDPDLDALDELRALVSGDSPFDLADTEEFIEGRVAGLDQAIVRQLRNGEYAVQGHVDLHGLTREEAKGTLDRFLRSARSAGKRCVLVVHGRGIHSKDQIPVLKEALRVWFVTARFRRHVLAFATARPVDGGAGALYVLLRRAGR